MDDEHRHRRADRTPSIASRRVGIVACSAEGAALCYRTISAEGARLLGPHGHPEVSMHAHPFADYVDALDRGDWAGVARLMLASAEKLAAVGADFLICPDNTIHQALPRIEPKSPRPWLHIAEGVAAEASARGFRRLGITGTRWLVESEVYPEKLAVHGLEWVRPESGERAELHRIIMDELVAGVFVPESAAYVQQVIARMKAAGCDAVVLGCTELPLLLDDASSPLPTLDSTRLLARAAVRRAAQILALAVTMLAGVSIGAGASAAAETDGWRADVPCGARLAAPVETALAGCTSSYCVASGGGRICSCLPDDGDSLEMRWEPGTGEPFRWEVELHSLPDASAFRVEQVALGSPPAPSLLVSVRAGQGNGMGIEDWSLRAIQGGSVSEPRSAHDYGLLAFPSHRPGDAECRILATRWIWARGPERGSGLYLYGRWLHLRDGALEPDPTRPIVARRYLYRFERQRLAGLATPVLEPLLWFRAASAKPPPCDDAFCR
jgi:aspartate racemase